MHCAIITAQPYAVSYIESVMLVVGLFMDASEATTTDLSIENGKHILSLSFIEC